MLASRAAALAGAAGAAGVSTLAAPLTARAQACGLEMVAELGLRDSYGFLTVEIGLGDRTVSMLLDTGSDAGLLAPEAARAAHVASVPLRVPVIGAEAGATLALGVLPAIRLGGLVLTDVAFPLQALPAAPSLVPPVAGLIGGDVLSRFEVELDVGRGVMRLHLGHGLNAACAGLPPWRGPFETIEARRAGNRMFVPVRLDGRGTEALLDTGARSRIVSRGLAQSVGVSAATLDAEPGGLTRGIDTREATYHWHRFRTLAIGGTSERDPVLTVAPLPGDETMLLGSDWFARHRVWLSYGTGRVFVAPR